MRQIPFSPPDISQAEIDEVCDALRSGWITTGPRVKQLEKNIAEYVGTKRAVCLGSQTACAEMALHVLGIGPGDEVIVPAYTYTATASVVCHVGAKPVIIDSAPDSVEMDYEKLEAAITDRTKVIIPVDLGGVPCDYDRLFEIAEKHRGEFKASSDIQKAIGRIVILADTAHALGATWNGRMIGSVADFSAFSFHAVKNFTTGEGGVLTWRSISGIDDDEIYRNLQLLSLHGQTKDALHKSSSGAWEYDVVAPWYKCNMTDIAAAMGLAQFSRYPGLLARRHEIIRRYDAAFKPLGVKTLAHVTENYTSSGHLYLTRIPGIDTQGRQAVIDRMTERGVATNVHYKPLPMLTAYKNLGCDIKDFPNAFAYYANEVTLPLYTRLSDEEVEYIIEQYTDVLKEFMPEL